MLGQKSWTGSGKHPVRSGINMLGLNRMMGNVRLSK